MAGFIEDYGIIGDTRTVALVRLNGSIDWLCAPRFDSDAFFAALLGHDEHGRWEIRPKVPVRRVVQRYRGDTLILETDFECDGGAVRIIDFMPLGEDRCDVVRIVVGLEGEVPLQMLLEPRFGYGADRPWLQRDGHDVSFTAGPEALCLRPGVEVEAASWHVTAVFTVHKGERVPFVLSWHPSHHRPPRPLDAHRAEGQTETWWRQWSSRCTYRGRYRDAVMRSLIVLKALTYAPTGGIVAAPTASLPEEIGGVRNWDYRFCWIRDATLTLQALMIGGYTDEALAWRNWLLRAAAGAPEQLQIMYGIAGERRLTEIELGWLPGYEGSHPVRIGNGAATQFQLDVYGEMFGCMYLARRMGIGPVESWQPAKVLLEFLEKAWLRPDEGIWEVRGGGLRHFTYSKIMAWVAFDRASRLIEEFGAGGREAEALLPHLHALRERVHGDVCQRGYSERLSAFTQSYGVESLDASVLLIPHVGFLPASDPRVLSTVRAIERDLMMDGFVRRYPTEHNLDGLPGSEGAFLACSFWLADNYAFAGRMDEAEEMFARLLSIRNHLGLLAEEYDPVAQRQLGNFPQAFSHLALVHTAQVLEPMKAAPSL